MKKGAFVSPQIVSYRMSKLGIDPSKDFVEQRRSKEKSAEICVRRMPHPSQNDSVEANAGKFVNLGRGSCKRKFIE